MESEIPVEGTGRLGPYQLLNPLSDSFFGVRWCVRSPGGESLRALRVVSGEAPERIASAAAAIRGIKHPSLLPPLELVRQPRALGIVTEHIEGETLRSLLQRAVQRGASIPQAVAVRITLDLLEALQVLTTAAQARPGMCLHGGLTPDSVHVGADGLTRLLDAGVAAAAARARNLACHPVRAAYSAPEHVDGDGDFDVRSDVFSLGVLLWESLACRTLFGDTSYEAVRERVLHDRIPRVQRDRFLRGEPIAAALASVVDRALQRDPDERFQSFEALADALRSASQAAEREGVARCVSGGAQAAEAPAPEMPAPAPESVARAGESEPPPQILVMEREPDEMELLDEIEPDEIEPDEIEPDEIESATLVEDVALVPDASEDQDVSEPIRLNDLGPLRQMRARGVIPLLVAMAVIAVLSFVAFQPGSEPDPASGRAERQPPERQTAQSSPLKPSHTMRAAGAAPPAAAVAPPSRLEAVIGTAASPAAAQPPTAGAAAAPAQDAPAERTRKASGRSRATPFVPNDI